MSKITFPLAEARDLTSPQPLEEVLVSLFKRHLILGFEFTPTHVTIFKEPRLRFDIALFLDEVASKTPELKLRDSERKPSAWKERAYGCVASHSGKQKDLRKRKKSGTKS